MVSKGIKLRRRTMSPELRTIVTFQSAFFNTNQPRDYFINPGCFGDDVANWLIGELRRLGVKTEDKPGQEDFGWYLNFYVSGIGHTFVIGYRPAYEDAEETWIGWLERSRGFIGSMFGARERGIDPFAAETLHKIFVSSPQIRNLRWHFQRDFNKRQEQCGANAPIASS
jgi:hypothetical protein